MALSEIVLATELKSMALFDNEAAARAAWAEAFRVYFEDAESNSVPIVVASLVPAEAAMEAALTGMSDSSQSGPKIQAGIQAFWGAIVPGTAWPTVTDITPPTLLSGLGDALNGVFSANTSSQLSKDDSYDAIAASIHTNNLGGIAVWPPTPGGPGPQPIL